jgi:hypothetical protein
MQHSCSITIPPRRSCDMSLSLLKQVHGCNDSTRVSRFTPEYQPISPSINRSPALRLSLHPNPRRFCVLQQISHSPQQVDMASKGLKSAIMCVLILAGLILEQVHADKFCCKGERLPPLLPLHMALQPERVCKGVQL